jgi:hypothetical protein
MVIGRIFCQAIREVHETRASVSLTRFYNSQKKISTLRMGMLGMVERPTETRFFIIIIISCGFFAHVNRVLAEEGMR